VRPIIRGSIRSALSARHVEPTARDLIAHDLHAAVIDPGLERAHYVVREETFAHRMRRAVVTSGVIPFR
jgi:hypothetical protein